MNIVFIARSFTPNVGGVENHLYEIAKRLKAKGHSITIVTEALQESSKRKDEFNVVRIRVGKNERSKKWIIWKELFNKRQIFLKADIIHCHDVFFWYLPFRILFPMKPVYTTFHGYETVFPPKKSAIGIRKLSEILSFKTINVGKFITKWYYSRPDVVMYGGVNVKDEVSLPKIHKRLRILFVGRIEEDTGAYVYSEVLQILSNQHIEFSFSAIGDGQLRKEFERWGEVHGYVTNTQEYIKKADIVFTSSYLSILETLVQKRLVFAIYQNKLKKDYLLMTPFSRYIEAAGDPVHLAYRVKSYYSNPQLFISKLEEGYAWAKTQTWDEVTNIYLKLWNYQKKD